MNTISTARFAAVVLALIVAACGGSTRSTVLGSAGETPAPTKLTVGLGFIPSVQFAQFYLAEDAGYYDAEGLDVTFQNEIDPNLITLVGQGAVDVGLADGTSVIPAASQGVPIRFVTTVYARFPNVVFAKASSGIESPEDLAGRTIGTPFRGGSGWIMLQALLSSADLTVADVEIREYPDFGQRVAVEQGEVDAATGFANNEPLVMERAGTPVTVLRVDEITPLPGPGLVTGTRTLEAKGKALAGFVRATLRAMDEIAAEPSLGLEAAIRRVPELASDRAGQLAILRATADAWQSDYTREHGLGAVDRDGWSRSVEFMASLPERLVPNPVTVDELVSEELLP
jgi:NitT/TauT family transport system substrate-binding protein